MTTLGGNVLTQAEIAKRTDPNGMPAKIANTLTRSSPTLKDGPWFESNMPTANRSTITLGLPTVNLRRLNEGTAPSRSTTAQVTDGMAKLDAWSTVDPDVLNQSKNPALVRMQEGEAFVEAIGQKWETLVWYGSEADDDREFNGLAVRYNSLSGNIGRNVLDAGGSGADNCSIYLVCWAPNKVFFIHPPGSVAGIRHRDFDLDVHQHSTDHGGELMEAYRDHWMLDGGVVVKDWRCIVRIANIDISEFLAVGGDQALDQYGTNVLGLMLEAMHLPPSLEGCRPVFYLPRSAFIAFDKQALARTSANVYRTEDVPGKPITVFRGVRMAISDALLYDEAVVS